MGVEAVASGAGGEGALIAASPCGTNRLNRHSGHLLLLPAISSGSENEYMHDGHPMEMGMSNAPEAALGECESTTFRRLNTTNEMTRFQALTVSSNPTGSAAVPFVLDDVFRAATPDERGELSGGRDAVGFDPFAQADGQQQNQALRPRESARLQSVELVEIRLRFLTGERQRFKESRIEAAPAPRHPAGRSAPGRLAAS